MNKILCVISAIVAVMGTISAKENTAINTIVESSKKIKLLSWNLILNGNERYHFVTDRGDDIYLTVFYEREPPNRFNFSHIELAKTKLSHASFQLSNLENRSKLKDLIAALHKDGEIDKVNQKRLKFLLNHFD